ncbi:hypothetical protein ACF0H5_023279 [Mactra antiquata]
MMLLVRQFIAGKILSRYLADIRNHSEMMSLQLWQELTFNHLNLKRVRSISFKYLQTNKSSITDDFKTIMAEDQTCFYIKINKSISFTYFGHLIMSPRIPQSQKC